MCAQKVLDIVSDIISVQSSLHALGRSSEYIHCYSAPERIVRVHTTIMLYAPILMLCARRRVTVWVHAIGFLRTENRNDNDTTIRASV